MGILHGKDIGLKQNKFKKILGNIKIQEIVVFNNLRNYRKM